MRDQPFERQAEQVLANVNAWLEAAGSDRTRLLQMRVYITDMNLWSAFNQIYAGGELRPARAVAGGASYITTCCWKSRPSRWGPPERAARSMPG